MFCDRCGVQVSDQAAFCSNCGRGFAPAFQRTGTQRLPANRAVQHGNLVAILWMIRGGLLGLAALTTGAIANLPFWNRGYVWQRMAWNQDWNRWHRPDLVPALVPDVLGAVSGFILVAAGAAFVTGWALYSRQPWARTLAIVLAILALFDFPFGTALGVFTLWTLRDEGDYRAWARTA